MPWYYHVIAVCALAVAIALWFLLQRFIARRAPELPGIERRCDDCVCGHSDGAQRGAACQRDQGRTDAPH